MIRILVPVPLFVNDFLKFSRITVYPCLFRKEPPVNQNGLTLHHFEPDFVNFERNRMYLPDYRKEARMITLNMKHYSALNHAEQFIIPSMKQGMEPRHLISIEKDIALLAEVRNFILQELYMPKLPVQEHDGI